MNNKSFQPFVNGNSPVKSIDENKSPMMETQPTQQRLAIIPQQVGLSLPKTTQFQKAVSSIDLANKIFSVFARQEKRKLSTDSFSRAGSSFSKQSRDNIDIDDKEIDSNPAETTKRLDMLKLEKKQVYEKAQEQLKIQPQNKALKTDESEAQENLNIEQQHQDVQLEEYNKALIQYEEGHKVNLSEMFVVEPKDEFELLMMYTDEYPLLKIRKIFIFIQKAFSFVCYRIIKHKFFDLLILCIILFNTVTLMLDDPTSSSSTPVQDGIENFFLIAYACEFSLKIVALGLFMNKDSYLKDGWNILDGTIVVSSLLPLVMGGEKSSVNLSGLRSLRVLRPLRTISSIRALKVILLTLFAAIPYLINTIIIMFFFFLVFAIGGLQLFKGLLKQRCYSEQHGIPYWDDVEYLCGGEQGCDYPNTNLYAISQGSQVTHVFQCGKMLTNIQLNVVNFDTIFYSFLMVFQCVTMEGWTDIMYAIFSTFTIFTMVYFIVLVFVGAFFLLNLTLAVIKAKFTDSDSNSTKDTPKTIIPLENEEVAEQKRLQVQEEQAKIDAAESSDSDGEQEPSLETMKNYQRQMRYLHQEQQKLRGLCTPQSNYTFGANTEKTFNFVFEDLMALKAKIEEEEKQQEELAHQEEIVNQYVQTQRVKIKRIFMKSKLIMPIKLNSVSSRSDPKLILDQQNQVQKELNQESKDKEGFVNQKRKSLKKPTTVSAPIINIEGVSQQTLREPHRTNTIRGKKPSSNDAVLDQAKKRMSMMNNKGLMNNLGSQQQLTTGRPDVTISPFETESRKAKNLTDDFDIILQDIDDLASNNLNVDDKKKEITKKRMMMLRSDRMDKGSQKLQIVKQKHDEDDVSSVNLSDVLDSHPTTGKAQLNHNINKKDPIFLDGFMVGADQEQDSGGDLLDDSDFIDSPLKENKDLVLAQAMFQQRLKNQQQQKKTIQNAKRGSVAFGTLGKSTNPKVRRFIIQGLQDHLNKINGVQDDQNIKQMQDMIGFAENDDNDQDLEVEVKVKRQKKQGETQNYKLVFRCVLEYFSSSTNDVVERRIKIRENERVQLLEKAIKDRVYRFTYELLDEGNKQVVKPTKNKRERAEQKNDLEISQQNIQQVSVMSLNTEMIPTNSTEQNPKLSLGIQRCPVHKGGYICRQRQVRIWRKMMYQQAHMGQNDSVMEAQDAKQNKNRSIRRRKVIRGPGLDLTNYLALRKVISDPIDECSVRPFDLPSEKIYYQILQQDFLTSLKGAIHWSGQDVLAERKVPNKRTNKIISRLDTDSQYNYIYLAGLSGYMKVKHRQLANFARGKLIDNFLTVAVVFNTVLLALDGLFYDLESLAILEILNNILTYIFISEMGLKLIAFTPMGYVRDKMNIFDGTIVSLSIMEMTLLSGGKGKAVSAFRSVRIFRTFRVLRVTRLLRSLKFMTVIIQVLSKTMEKFVYICTLMFLFIIIYALLGMQMYGGQLNFYRNPYRQNFDNFADAFMAIFQLLSLENWNDILVCTLQSSMNPFITCIYLISWIFIGNWVFLNLFLAILIDGFTTQLEGNEEEENQLPCDEKFQKNIDNMVLDANPDLADLKKENDYQLQQQFLEETENNRSLNASINSQKEDDLEIDINSHTIKNKKPMFHGIMCEDSLFIFTKRNPIRKICYRVVENPNFENVILVFIMISSLKLAVDTYFVDGTPAANVSLQIDLFFNIAFMCECALKIISFGFYMDENSYLTESWSQLDFFIVSASLVDMSFQGIDLPFIKILRLLRTLRPLRFISHNVNMKMVVIALLESLGGMINVIIVVSLIWLMFGILGISLLGNRMGYCSFPGITPSNPSYGVNINMCHHGAYYKELGATWKIHYPNFDNIYNAMTTLYILSTLEGWPDIMFPTLDSDYSEYGPSKNNFKIMAVYFVIFILIGSFFLINLFVGVICFYFEQASKNEKRHGNIFLTQEQENWIEIQRMTIGVAPEFTSFLRPINFVRGKIYDLVTYGVFDVFIMICIVMNIMTMAMAFEGSKPDYDGILEKINLFFTSVFIMETSFKIIAFGFSEFWSSGWNQFDFFVVASSILDLTLQVLGGNTISFLRVGPQLIRIVRVLRVTRLLKLVKSMRGLQKLILTLLYSLPSLLNIGTLLLLVYFIFSVLGVFMFQNASPQNSINNYNNFETFGIAMLTLFRCSTGENWYIVMKDVIDQNPIFAPVYFLSFITICTFVMLNLFVLIIIQYFENYNLKAENPLDTFQENLEIFRKHWNKFSYHFKGEKMHQRFIIIFFADLPPPLGFGAKCANTTIAKEVMNMQLIGDGMGYVFFNELLYASMKRAFGNRIFRKAQKDLNMELQQILSAAERDTKGVIEKNKTQELKRSKSQYLPNPNNFINPLITYLYNRIAFLSWKNYSIMKCVDEQDTPLTEEDEDEDEEGKDQIDEDYSPEEQDENIYEEEDEEYYDDENDEYSDQIEENDEEENVPSPFNLNENDYKTFNSVNRVHKINNIGQVNMRNDK